MMTVKKLRKLKRYLTNRLMQIRSSAMIRSERAGRTTISLCLADLLQRLPLLAGDSDQRRSMAG
jgi:hypothetical protein